MRARKILLKWNWSHASRGHSRENKKELTSAKIQCTQLSAVSKSTRCENALFRRAYSIPMFRGPSLICPLGN